MKKLVFSISTVMMLLFPQLLNAQINLEHTFQGYVTANYPYVNPIINCYTDQYPGSSNQVKLYNEDYSLYKAITVTPPANYAISFVQIYSKNIVTTDNKMTFFVVFVKASAADNTRSILKLYDENGTLVRDFGYAYTFSLAGIHETPGGKYRLSVLRYKYSTEITYETEIYSLPGVPPPPPVPPTITTTILPSGMVGMEYNTTLAATGDAPIVWTLESGSLPVGLDLSSAGIISGTPTVKETADFTVKAANEAGSDTKELSIFIDEETGISVLQIAELKIFPNPTSGELMIMGSEYKVQSIEIFDAMGKKVQSFETRNPKSETVNVSHLPSGVYFVQIQTETDTIVRKVVKN
jgi:hypothetical protein